MRCLGQREAGVRFSECKVLDQWLLKGDPDRDGRVHENNVDWAPKRIAMAGYANI
jgi:hypothetical protein